jgi:hypothetical protein
MLKDRTLLVEANLRVKVKIKCIEVNPKGTIQILTFNVTFCAEFNNDCYVPYAICRIALMLCMFKARIIYILRGH